MARHTDGEYVRDQAHTSGIESSGSLRKRGYSGTSHRRSAKPLDRSVGECAARHNQRSQCVRWFRGWTGSGSSPKN